MARPVEHHEPRIQTSVRFTRATRDRLKRFSVARCVGRDLVVERAVVDFLDRQDAAAGPEPLDWRR